MIYLEILFAVVAFLLLVPVLVVFVQVLCACLPVRIREVARTEVDATNPGVAVLIPAHNESSGIAETLATIRPQLKKGDRIVVVADNCSDDTAAIAARNGAEVIERQDLTRRGKGYALDFGMQHLLKAPPDVVVVIDADCSLERHVLQPITNLAFLSGRPVQALYLMHGKEEGMKSAIAGFAWRVKNFVRPLGFANLGLPCQLMGTGMAFPWKVIAGSDLANGNIVEDMKLGIDLTLAGTPPLFYPHAKVTSYFPLAAEAQKGQSTRWEHGHLDTILRRVPGLLGQGIIHRDKSLIALALDLSVPPLALLVMLLSANLAITSVFAIFFGSVLTAFQVNLLAFGLLLTGIVIAWWRWGREVVTFSAMLMVPLYVVRKIPQYISFVFKKQKVWNRTERD